MADIDNKTQAPAEGMATVQETTKTEARAASEAKRQLQPRPCPQDCSKCSMPQHIFCSTKMLFDLSRAYQEQRQQNADLAKAIADIREQLKPKEQEALLSIPFDRE